MGGVKTLGGPQTLFQRSQPLADGVFGQLGDIVDIELIHNLFAVGFHSLDTDTNFIGDLFGGATLGHELKDFSLARTEHGEDRIGLLGIEIYVIFDYGFGYGFIEIILILIDSMNGIDKGIYRAIFQDISESAGLERFQDKPAIGVHGKHNDFGFRVFLNDPTGRFYTVQIRHRNIHQNNIGLLSLDRLDRLDAIAGLGNHLDIAAVHKQVAKAVPEQAMIIGYDYAYRHFFPHR
jgi:hypothetical protein